VNRLTFLAIAVFGIFGLKSLQTFFCDGQFRHRVRSCALIATTKLRPVMRRRRCEWSFVVFKIGVAESPVTEVRPCARSGNVGVSAARRSVLTIRKTRISQGFGAISSKTRKSHALAASVLSPLVFLVD
jgi:hypothetical protein